MNTFSLIEEIPKLELLDLSDIVYCYCLLLLLLINLNGFHIHYGRPRKVSHKHKRNYLQNIITSIII